MEVSDATLVQLAYEKWGTACVEHLLGDFAFALWDARSRELFCARDALGVRDLSYWISERVFVAASEVVEVLAHPAVPRRLNEGRLGEYLANYWHNHHETFFERVYYCPPAHCLLVGEKSFRSWRYWDLDPGRITRHRRDEEYVEEFRDLITNAVEDRLRLRGRVAVSLSGGPDSVALAAIAARAQPSEPLPTFSYVFDRFPSCDERRYIQPVVDECGLDATYIIGDELWPLSDLATWPVFPDFATQDPYVRLPMAIIDGASDAGCRVILNGHYSDILFAGGKYWAADLLSPGHVPQLLGILARERQSVAWWDDLVRYGAWMKTPRRVRSAVRKVRRTGRARPISDFLQPGLIERTGLRERLRAMDEVTMSASPSFVARYRHLLFAVISQGTAACRRLYNRRGVERVEPYWDRRLVEYVQSLPAHLLERPPMTKWLLRQAMVDLVPEPVLARRDKTSLDELYCEGILHRERARVEELLKEPDIVARGLVKAAWLRRELEAGTELLEDGFAQWRCLTAELWLRTQWDGGRGQLEIHRPGIEFQDRIKVGAKS